MPNEPRRITWRDVVGHPGFICSVILAAAIASYWPIVHGGFIYCDDPDYVTANPHVSAGLTWAGTVWAFTTAYASNWHPLTWLSHMADVEMFGKEPAGPHCVNLALHLANSALLFVLLRRMTGAVWRSAFVAALFALHPLHVESVAWISERKDVLSTLFWMLTLLAYVQYAAKGGKSFYVLALVLFAFGLMSKPMLVTLPFVLLLLDYWPLGRLQSARFWVLLREKAPFFLLTIMACMATLEAQHQAIQPLENLPLPGRMENAVVSYLRYIGKTVWPKGLAILYPYPEHWPAWLVVAAALVVGGGCVIVWASRKRFPFVFTGWFWFVGTLVPVIGLVQVGSQSMADRYTYIPVIGLFVAVSWGAFEALEWSAVPRWVVVAGAPAIVLVCGALTRQQAGYWRDNESLCRHTVAVTPRNYVALSSLGVSFFHEGKLIEAVDCYRKSLEINPNYADAMNNMGVLLASQGKEEAFEWYHKALQARPKDPSILYNLANELAMKKRSGEAVPYLEEVLRLQPEHYQAHNNLANALAEQGKTEEAMAHYRLALQISPRDIQVRKNFAGALVRQGDARAAIPLYMDALKDAPNEADLRYGFGLALAVQGRWQEAIEQYLITVRLAPTNAEAQYNLGYALKEQGRLAEATGYLREAVRLKPDLSVAQYNLGCVLADQGKSEEGIAHLKEALRIKPQYDEAHRRLNALTRDERMNP